MRPLLILLFSCALADADAILSTDALANVANNVCNPPTCADDSHTIPLPALNQSLASGVQLSGVQGSASATAWAGDVNGNIYLKGTVSASSNFGSDPGGDSFGTVANSIASITDSFTLLQGTSGTQFQWIYELSGRLAATLGDLGDFAEAAVSFMDNVTTLPNANASCDGQLPPGSFKCFDAADPSSGIVNQLVTVDIPAIPNVGTDVTFTLSQTARTVLSASASSDFIDTAQLVGFNVLDAQGNIVPNAVVSTASGVDYFSVNAAPTTPEPGTITLLFGAAFIFAGYRALRVKIGARRA